MRGLGLGLVLWALGATVASAAVLRIDVTGTPIRADLVTYFVDDGMPARTLRSFELADVEDQITERQFVDPALEFLSSTTGWVEIGIAEGSPRASPSVLACDGILAPICASRLTIFSLEIDFVQSTVFLGATDSADASYTLQNSRFSYTQRTCPGAVVVEGVPYRCDFASGLVLQADLSALRYSFVEPAVVPLPASASLVLAGLGALVLLRRRGRGRVGRWG
jgi:hypothetical protein